MTSITNRWDTSIPHPIVSDDFCDYSLTTRLLIGAGGGALGGALGGWLLSVLAQAVSGAGNSEPIQYLRT
ncbi:MAG: hypothetical protein ACREKN_00880, partial [Longimicrobiaceae bacterium]